MAVEIDRKEIFRYLGYRGNEADPTIKELVESCIEELLRTAEPRALVGEYPITVGRRDD